MQKRNGIWENFYRPKFILEVIYKCLLEFLFHLKIMVNNDSIGFHEQSGLVPTSGHQIRNESPLDYCRDINANDGMGHLFRSSSSLQEEVIPKTC